MSSSTPTFLPIIVDVLFVLVAAIFIAVGVKRGFIKSLIQSAKFLLALVVTYFVGPIVSQFVNGCFVSGWVEKVGASEAAKLLPKFARPAVDTLLPKLISNIIGYVITFVLALVLLTIVAWLLTKVTEKIALLGTANRILGGLFGAAMGLIVLFIIASIIKFLDAKDAIYSQTVIVEFLGNIFS